MEVKFPTYGYNNCVSKRELKTDEKIFNEAIKLAKKSEVRDADWGSYAAQSCLARDLINADADEVALIMDKMTFLQNLMNDNLEVDSKIYGAKSDARVKRNGATCNTIKTTSDAVKTFTDSAGNMITTIVPLGAGKFIDYAA